MSTIKALTLYQPWASLIAMGYKRTETRSWNTHFRGPIAIHAGLAMLCRRGERVSVGPFEVERDEGGLLLRGAALSWPYRLPLGAVVAVAELYQTRSTTNLEHCPSDLDRSLGDHSPGRWAWYLSRVCRIPTVCASGSRGLWDWKCPDELVEGLHHTLRDSVTAGDFERERVRW